MKRRILLVDDDVAVLLTLKAVLEMHGFEVHTAQSGSEAMEKLKLDRYHMVITDLRLESDNTGWQVVRAAREQPYRPATAILTAYPPLEGNEQERGAQSVLVKPVGTKDLLRQIEALLVRNEDDKQRLRTDANTTTLAADIPADRKQARKAS